MRTGITLAWLAGLGLVTYRTIAREHHPPLPGQLLGVSGVFVALALVAEIPQASTFAAVTAWGFDLAAFLNILPGGLTGGTTGKAAKPGGPQNAGAAPTVTGA